MRLNRFVMNFMLSEIEFLTVLKMSFVVICVVTSVLEEYVGSVFRIESKWGY